MSKVTKNLRNHREEEFVYFFHDLRNKVTQAKSCINEAFFEQDSLQQNEWLKLCSNALERSNELLDDSLRSYYLKHNNEYSNGFHRFLIQDYLKNQVSDFYVQLSKQYNIKFEVSYQTINEDKFFYINPKKIHRLRENIIENAINAKADKLTIHYAMKREYLVISYTDNGQGMNQEQLDQIMMKKYKTGQIHGLGTQYLLSTAEEHKLSIMYNSEIGEGTEIRLLCPYVE